MSSAYEKVFVPGRIPTVVGSLVKIPTLAKILGLGNTGVVDEPSYKAKKDKIQHITSRIKGHTAYASQDILPQKLWSWFAAAFWSLKVEQGLLQILLLWICQRLPAELSDQVSLHLTLMTEHICHVTASKQCCAKTLLSKTLKEKSSFSLIMHKGSASIDLWCSAFWDLCCLN